MHRDAQADVHGPEHGKAEAGFARHIDSLARGADRRASIYNHMVVDRQPSAARPGPVVRGAGRCHAARHPGARDGRRRVRQRAGRALRDVVCSRAEARGRAGTCAAGDQAEGRPRAARGRQPRRRAPCQSSAGAVRAALAGARRSPGRVAGHFIPRRSACRSSKFARTPKALTMTVVAQFAAPVARVWAAYADPRQLERFWGPPEWPATFVRHDFVVGGRSEYYMTGPNGEQSRGFFEFLSHRRAACVRGAGRLPRRRTASLRRGCPRCGCGSPSSRTTAARAW